MPMLDSLAAEKCREFAVVNVINGLRILQSLGLTDIDRDCILAEHSIVRRRRDQGWEQACGVLEQILNFPEGEP